jgi:hypothetical protein
MRTCSGHRTLLLKWDIARCFFFFLVVLFKEWGEAEFLVTATLNDRILSASDDRRKLICHIEGMISGGGKQKH